MAQDTQRACREVTGWWVMYSVSCSPTRLYHAATDSSLQRQLHLLGERQPERAAQPSPGGVYCHPGPAAGAPGCLGPVAAGRDHLSALLWRPGEALQHGEAHEL